VRAGSGLPPSGWNRRQHRPGPQPPRRRPNEPGQADEALASYKEALELTRKEEGESGYRGALILENMANVYFQKKELDTAQDMLGEVLKTRESLFGPDSMTTARTRFNMSSIAIRRADFKLGLELADAVLPIFKKNVGEKSPDYAQVIRNRAECLKGLGDTEAALRELRAALDIIDAAAAPSSPQRLRILLITVETYCQRGETDNAQATTDLALKVLDQTKPDQAKWIKNFRDLLAKCNASPKSPSP